MFDTKPTQQGFLATTMKRNQYSRDAIMGVLQSLGMPVALDESHIVFTDCDAAIRWMVVAGDDQIASLFSAFEDPDKYGKAREAFRSLAPPIAIKHVMSPGVSMRGGAAVLDGCAMRVRINPRVNANEGPEAFVVPVRKEMMMSGAEWVQMVALVPKAQLPEWMAIVHAAHAADRSFDVRRQVMRVYNGPDVPISPMSLDGLILDDRVLREFPDDITGFLSRRDWYVKRSLPWSRKYLLDGPPGTGKTSLARWAATSLGMPAISFDFTDKLADGRDFSMCLSYAGRRAPCLLVLDDIDKVFGGDNKTGITAHTLLTAFSGMSGMDGVIVIATSNSTNPFKQTFNNDPSTPMMRRFDQIVKFPLPTAEHRLRYLERLLNEDGVGMDALTTMAQSSDGWSFDDLRAAVTSAANRMIARKGDTINEDDLNHGIRAVTTRRDESTPIDG